MKTQISLAGSDALTVGKAGNRLPEVLAGTTWKSASGITEAARFLREDPQLVRLVVAPRAIVEDVLRTGIPKDADLASVITSALQDTKLDELARQALTIIEKAMA